MSQDCLHLLNIVTRLFTSICFLFKSQPYTVFKFCKAKISFFPWCLGQISISCLQIDHFKGLWGITHSLMCTVKLTFPQRWAHFHRGGHISTEVGTFPERWAHFHRGGHISTEVGTFPQRWALPLYLRYHNDSNQEGVIALIPTKLRNRKKIVRCINWLATATGPHTVFCRESMVL